MAENLVTLVMQYLNPDMIKRIAAALGIDTSSASAAVSASVPALLAGIGGVATQTGGAQKLLDTAREQSGTLDKFSTMVGGDKAALIDKGSQMLSSLVGSQQQSALAGAVAKFSGLTTATGSSLLGMLAPVVMGVIGRQPAAYGSNSGALGNLLASQNDNIAEALPSGFSRLLSGTGLLDRVGGLAGTATAAAGQATRAATASVSSGAQRTASAATAGVGRWLYLLIAAVVVAVVAWFVFDNRTRTVPKPVEQGVTQTPELVVDGVNVRTQLGDNLASLQTSLQGVTDAASAQAALPKLQGVAAEFDKIAGLVSRLSPDQRKIAAGLVSPMLPTLNQLFDKLLAMPEVSATLKPTIDALRASLTTIAA